MWSSSDEFWSDVRKWGEMDCYIHLRPDHCVCAKDVDGEAWFIYLAVGDLRELLELLPYPLPQIGWGRELRNRDVKYYPTEKVLAIASKLDANDLQL